MIVLVLLFHLIAIFQKCSSQASTEAELKDFLYNNYEKAASENCTKLINAEWDYITDQKNDTKSEIFSKIKKENEAFNMEYWDKYFKNLNPNDYKDEKIKRQLKILRHLEEMRAAEDSRVTADPNDLWSYESPDIFKEIDNLWEQVEPLFMELRKYMARKLKEKFGKLPNGAKTEDGFFGYKFVHSFEKIMIALRPFPDVKMVNMDNIVNAALKEQKYTVLKMFQTANEFFKSMGLLPNDISYDVGKGAMIEDGSKVKCHASAWDFCDRKTFRIRMCAEVNTEDFLTIHHELGHIQYFLQYAQQPYIFRTGAIPGFHEAVSESIALSVNTPKHWKKIGLLKNFKESKEAYLNSLMDLALVKVNLLPFGNAHNSWRSNDQYGKVKSHDNNWYRNQYLEIKPRSEKADGKYSVLHEPSNIAFFVDHILLFQIYKSLCIAAGEYNPKNKKVPLHRCDFYQSKEAGKKLSAGLALGSSENWRNVLEKITGDKKMDVSGLLEYFEPLHQFLTNENPEENSKVVTEDDNTPNIMRESNSVGTMGSTMYFVVLIEIIVCICIS